MKGLAQFVEFDWDEFGKGKEFTVTGVSEWADFKSKQHLGTKVDVVITTDNTKYRQKEGQQVSNLYEKLTIKVTKDTQVSIGTKVIPVNPVCSVYGEFRNQLSIRCDDVQVVQSGAGAKV